MPRRGRVILSDAMGEENKNLIRAFFEQQYKIGVIQPLLSCSAFMVLLMFDPSI